MFTVWSSELIEMLLGDLMLKDAPCEDRDAPSYR